MKRLRENYSEYEARRQVKERITINYEEWKKAVERPNSKESYNLAIKSRIICMIGEELIEDLSADEKRDYKEFWKNFRIDTNDIIPDNCSKETAELIFDYAIPAILEMQIDISKTYKTLFNFNNLSEGEKFLIYTHIKHDLKYKSLGNKRKSYLERFMK